MPTKLVSLKFLAFLLIILILTAFSGFLYSQNQDYKAANRRLIIENDSIQSINMKLANALEQKQTSLTFKTAR